MILDVLCTPVDDELLALLLAATAIGSNCQPLLSIADIDRFSHELK